MILHTVSVSTPGQIMNRHERREKERELKKREEKIRKEEERFRKEPGPQNRLRWVGQVILAIIGLGLGFGSYLAVARPHVSVEPALLLNPGDPYSTQFSVTNENSLFAVRDLHPSCRTIDVVTSNNVGMFGMPPRLSPPIPRIEPRAASTIACPPWIGGLGAGAGNVIRAFIEIDVAYKQAWWPFEQTQRFPFKGVIDSQKGVHWTHRTLSDFN